MSVDTFTIDRTRPRNVFSLNGIWQLQQGLHDTIPDQFASTVHVPALVDIAYPEYDWKTVDHHYYRKIFRIDGSDNSLPVFLKIGQAQFGTTVWLNRQPVGGSISCYTSQEYRLDDALRWGEDNELIVRVGAKRTLPPESAVGKDQEKERFVPGIWGDVSLVACGNVRVKLAQIIPHIDTAVAEARISVENLTDRKLDATLLVRAIERSSRKEASKPVISEVTLTTRQTQTIALNIHITDLKLWSPDTPYLYELQSTVLLSGVPADELRTTFGMREFTIKGKGFYLNGERIFLKGSNIAFHRFLSDKERGLLPWDRKWIKRVLIDIPKAHNFNFFRNHLGQMYNAWYDLADEYGMLIQNEWQFWGTTGTKEQITKEFTEWLQDNRNHPSIIIWDPLNESTDDVVQKEIVPEMKKLDPTRPWESVDFVEEHPYIYSLGPVLNSARFGFARSLNDIKHSQVPTMLNEFVWWWLNSEAEPTVLMNEVVERWLGPSYSEENLLQHQAFLAQELVELFRRMRVDAIQPFVYLSNNEGPTSHWFLGPISQLKPKPILAALKNAFAPFGISIELWDRHFSLGERRTIGIFVFNDESVERSGVVEFGVVNASGDWVRRDSISVSVTAKQYVSVSVSLLFPSLEGSYRVRAELKRPDGMLVAWSEKIAHVFAETVASPALRESVVAVVEITDEIKTFLMNHGISNRQFSRDSLDGVDILVIAHAEVRDQRYQRHIEDITRFVESGGSLVVIEPEFLVHEKAVVSVLNGLQLDIEYMEDRDRGGYDSYVFAVGPAHPLWNGISSDHLKMFNGGYGGEVVSQHNVVPNREPIVHARCGLGLKIPAVMEIPFVAGRILISRLQVRNRLSLPDSSNGFYARRIDPVLQRYVLNLLTYAHNLSARTRINAAASVDQR